MKTLIHALLDSPYNDGFGYQENILAAKHKALGYDVYIISCNDGQKTPRTYIDKNGIPVHVLAENTSFLRQIPGIKGWTDVTVGLKDLLDELQPDVIFIHNICKMDNLQFVEYKKQHPQTQIFADNHSDYYNTPVDNLQGKYTRYIIGRYIAKRLGDAAEKIWGVTPWRVTYLTDVYHVPKEKVGLLIMGGDEDDIRWNMRAEIRRQIRKRLNIPDEAFLVITGGKIDRAKNTHSLVEAVRQLSASHNIYLMVFGRVESDMKEYFEGINDDNIIKLGWITPKETNDYYLASDLACFPGSHSVLWEQACACGLPGIFKDWEGGYSHVDIGGNCILLKDTSINGITHCIAKLLSDKEAYEKMKLIASTKCREVFSYTTIAKKAIALIPS